MNKIVFSYDRLGKINRQPRLSVIPSISKPKVQIVQFSSFLHKLATRVLSLNYPYLNTRVKESNSMNWCYYVSLRKVKDVDKFQLMPPHFPIILVIYASAWLQG